MQDTGWVEYAAVILRAVLLGAATALVSANGLARGDIDSAWDYASLYRSDTGWLRSADLSGRLQADAAHVDADQGNWNDLLWRRFRFGARVGLEGGWLVHIEGDFDLDEWDGEFYNRLTDAYLGWESGSGLEWKLLKQSAGFTLDGETSSKKLLTPERNALTRNLWFSSEYFTGVTAAGGSGSGWQYKVGAFSSDGDDEISAFSASYFGLFSLGRDMAADLGLDAASWRVDYVYNDRHKDANTPDFEQVLSLNSQWRQGDWGVSTDLAAGRGFGAQSDVIGVVLMPYYQLSERWQLVLRYSLLHSDNPNGLRLGRYEDRVVSSRGDRYEEGFAGINLFLNGHKLKWQSGLQYASMEDEARDGGRYRGLAFSTVLRLYW